MLTWVNQVDPRVMLNEAAAETWAYAMRMVPADVAKQAVLEHYKAHENIAATPGAISKRAGNIKASREAGQRAIEAAPKPVRHPLSWRSRNPGFWDQLFEQGRAEGNAMRRAATERRNGIASDGACAAL
jgi:spore cortex formation protein SpoVR/YcgB (stage V sporulation)